MKKALHYLFPVLLCLFLIEVGAANGQESFYPKGLYVRLGATYTPVISPLKFSPVIDPLISLPTQNVSVAYEIQWQIGRRFGIVFQYNYVNIATDIRGNFMEQLQREFPDDYVTFRLGDLSSQMRHGQGPTQGFLGCSYAFDAGKWSLQPRILAGGTTFFPLGATVALKRRDSNQLSTLTLKPNQTPEFGSVSTFTFGLGTLVQRHLWRRWSLFGTAEWTTFKPDLLYYYTLENQVDGSTVTKTFGSSRAHLVHMIHAGAGLTFRITRKRGSR